MRLTMPVSLLRRTGQNNFQGKALFLRRNARALAHWPLIFIILTAVLWVWVTWLIAHDKEVLQDKLFLSAAAQARAGSEQVERSIGQIDYLMLSLVYHWQKTGGAVDLEEQVRAGLVPKSTDLSVTIFNEAGRTVTSTVLGKKQSGSIAHRPYFTAHAADPQLGLSISEPMISMLKRRVIFLSRRLNAPDGSFAGVVVVAVEPRNLLSLSDDTNLGPDDFMAVQRRDGVFFAARQAGVALSSPLLVGSNAKLAESSGNLRAPADWFADGKERILAWQNARTYQVVSLVGLSENSQLAAQAVSEHELLLFAGAGTLGLLLLTGFGISHSARRVWKNHHSREVHEAYRLATENAREGFYMLRALAGPDDGVVDFLIEDCNERGAAYRGLPRQALIGSKLSTILPVLFSTTMFPACRMAMANGFHEDEMFVPPRDHRPAQWLHRRLIRTGGCLAVTLRDITDSKTHQQEMAHLANTDPVTMLPNRHWLTAYLPEAVANAAKKGAMLAVLFADLDDFKNINDTVGHVAGDTLLKAAGLRLCAVIRPQDKIARLGGDEFTIIVESANGRDDVTALAERIIATLAEPFQVEEGGQTHSVKASIGISLYPADGQDGDTLLRHADIAMYSVKSSGKGTYRYFEPDLSRRRLSRLRLEAELKHAIGNDELVLHYQPRVNAMTGELTSMEALVRWMHPVHGLLAPNEFIPLAEETGIIVPLGAQVIEMACKRLAGWKKQGLQVVPVSVNVSAYQICTGEVSALLASALQRYGLEAALLEVEITESATMGEGNTAVAALADIQALGIDLYVDDFGTGYSCLAELKRLRMDGIKIDRAFTSRLLNGEDDRALFTAIVSIARAFGMRIVAEGVETAEQLQALQRHACDEVQGYYVSRPVAEDAAAALLVRRFLFP
nr:EAL domain-containing protein [uncultured Noviherbaspirillum sp.]